jgi:hypothetical protein
LGNWRLQRSRVRINVLACLGRDVRVRCVRKCSQSSPLNLCYTEGAGSRIYDTVLITKYRKVYSEFIESMYFDQLQQGEKQEMIT